MRFLIFLIMLLPVILLAYVDVSGELISIDTLIEAEKIDLAFEKVKELQKEVSEADPYFPNIVNKRIDLGNYLGYQNLNNAMYDQALLYYLDAYDSMQKWTSIVNEDNLDTKYVIVNDILDSYFRMGNFSEADKYRKILYDANDQKLLPKYYDEGDFWFDFFKEGKYNVRGYEVFAPLPEDRFSSSFSKIIYYIHSTKKDGSDKKEVLRLHVLMFHGTSQKIDYVMTLRKGYKNKLKSQTLWQYTYKADIDYSKLYNDIRQVVKEIVDNM